MRTHHHHLVEVEIESLRPTQITVGRAEVELKRGEWRRQHGKDKERVLAQHWFPSVLGPKGKYYIVDHHHLGLALHEEGISSGWAMVLRDFSMLDLERFWRVMEFHQWAHPYDETGGRRGYGAIPKRVTGLRDDPYRSLAGFVRNAGGFAKDATPYAEFLWADYFRLQVDVRLIKRAPKQAQREALALARDRAARYLPGWTGDLAHRATG
jgi:hypothetical protein